MEEIFQINPDLDVPIYRQLVDRIRAGVKKGTLVAGQQLPTVQEVSNSLGIARGTIKRVYDELEHLGILEKIQGRGTFICYQPANSGSRKEQAMAAIDELLDRLEEIGFTPMEIGIFLDLKQRERAEDVATVRVALVECNPENVAQMSEQLHTIKGIDLYSYLLSYIQQYPYKLDEEMDMVITTAEHAEYLESILPDRRKLARVALRLSMDTLSGIVKLRSGENAGILCCSTRFCDLVFNACRNYTRNVSYQQPRLFGSDLDIDSFLADKDAVLVPENYEKYCSQEVAKKLADFEKKAKLIRCSFEMDDGSFLSLEEKLRTLREEKAK